MDFRNISIKLTVNISNYDDENLKHLGIFKSGELEIPSFFTKKDFENVLQEQIYRFYKYNIVSYSPNFNDDQTINDLFPNCDSKNEMTVNFEGMEINPKYVKIHVTYEYVYSKFLYSAIRRKDIYAIIEKPNNSKHYKLREHVINAVLNKVKNINQFPNICTKINDEPYHYYCACNEDYIARNESITLNDSYLFSDGFFTEKNDQYGSIGNMEMDVGLKSVKFIDHDHNSMISPFIKRRHQKMTVDYIDQTKEFQQKLLYINTFFTNTSKSFKKVHSAPTIDEEALKVLFATGNDLDLASGFYMKMLFAQENFKKQEKDGK